MRVKNILPEDVTQSMNPNWPTETAEEQRVRKVKSIVGPRNDMYNSLAVGTALNEEDDIQ